MRYAGFQHVLFALLTLTMPELARGQGDSHSAGSPRATAPQMAALAALRPDNTVRVHALGVGWLSGSVIRTGADSLVLGLNGSDRVLQTAAIDSMLVRHSHVGLGAGLGALAGMLVGARAGGCTQPPATSLGAAAAAIGPQISCGVGHVMIGLAIGAGVGAIVGELLPSWERRLPEPDDSDSLTVH